MQTTTSITKSSNLMLNLGLLIGLAAAVALFLVTIERMGFLSVGRAHDTAVADAITLTIEDLQFAQSELRVKAGETVTLQLDNTDFLLHSFDVDAFDIHVPMPINERVSTTFTLTEPGIYTFYCGVPGHREAGMVGTLVVTKQ